MNEITAATAPTSLPPPQDSLTVFDIVGLAFGAFGLLWSAAAAFKVQPTFEKMFADFGQPLPAFTELCLRPWFPLMLGFVPLIIVSEGVIRKANRSGRVVRMGLAIFLTLALPGIFLVGMYWPILSASAR